MMRKTKKNKKVRWSLLAGLLLSFLFSSCKSKETVPVVPLQEMWTKYVTENTVFAYTLEEDGSLYTLEYNLAVQKEEPEWLTSETPVQITEEMLAQLNQKKEDIFFLRKYNVKGEREYSKVLEESLASCVDTMAIKDGIVYFAPHTVSNGEKCTVLYSYCPETEKLTVVKELPYFKTVHRIIPMGDCFYLLGTNVEGVQERNSNKYVHTGEKLFRYTVSGDKFEELGIAEPMDVCTAEDGKLCVYAHMGEEFCLLLYDTSRDAMQVLAKTNEYKMANVAFCSAQQDVIYQTVQRGLVLSSLSDLEVECELYPEGFFWDNNLCYVNGNIACETLGGDILRFALEDIKCENKGLRYITAINDFSEPFGCGYEMQRTLLGEDKFALKVMALDKDFDVCFVDSNESFCHNLKENGAFYPLNEVEGIQEYLDACFPYVKEAATDKDGNIWMLPVAVNIRGLLVGQEARDEILIKKNMTYEEYCSAYEKLSQEEKAVTEPPVSFVNKFVEQYIFNKGTVDTADFRDVLQVMARSNSVSMENTAGKYCRTLFESDYRAYFALQYGPDATVYAEPKLNASDKNAGSCMFLAVNPYSDNLDTTLQYISSLISYTMAKEEAPLFFANREVDGSSYDRSLYELYRDGTITFSIDGDVYAGYSDVLDGTASIETYIMETEAKVKIFFNE